MTGEKVYILTYADDIVMMAEDECGMRSMMERLEEYLEKKGLELNITKTKIMRCKKEWRRMKKVEWRWKGKPVAEVKEIKYLGATEE